jgi:hypothetical protein
MHWHAQLAAWLCHAAAKPHVSEHHLHLRRHIR